MILKSAIGNRALGWDLLPPGSEGFEFTDRRNGTALELQASLRGRSLVLTSPHGQRTILRRVVEEMEARDWAFFVKGTG